MFTLGSQTFVIRPPRILQVGAPASLSHYAGFRHGGGGTGLHKFAQSRIALCIPGQFGTISDSSSTPLCASGVIVLCKQTTMVPPTGKTGGASGPLCASVLLSHRCGIEQPGGGSSAPAHPPGGTPTPLSTLGVVLRQNVSWLALFSSASCCQRLVSRVTRHRTPGRLTPPRCSCAPSLFIVGLFSRADLCGRAERGTICAMNKKRTRHMVFICVASGLVGIYLRPQSLARFWAMNTL